MTPRPSPAEVTRAFATLLRYSISDECAEAMDAENKYKRLAVRQAFNAGWFAWRYRVQLGEGWTAPQLSRVTRAAFRRGMEAREQYETQHPTVRMK